jgi:hypothetical protein
MNKYFNSVKDLTYRNILWIFNKGLASMPIGTKKRINYPATIFSAAAVIVGVVDVAAATAVSQVSSPPTRCSEQSSSIH